MAEIAQAASAPPRGLAGFAGIEREPARAPVTPRAGTPVADPECGEDVRRELREGRHLGRTGDGKELFLLEGRQGGALMRELGRLREVAFRQAGGGTGEARDLDAFDAHYRHLVLWSDADRQVVGAYRIGEAGPIVASRGLGGLYTHGLFAFGERFDPYLPLAVELGRSFVQPRYRGLRALDALWQGIGAYLQERPEVRYLFGPVSVSADYPEAALKLLVFFYRRHFASEARLATARLPFRLSAADEAALAAEIPGEDCARDFRALKRRLGEMGVGVPTLYKQYTELCDPGGARFLGFGVDPAFAGCVDGLVLVDLHRLKASRRERYLGVPRPREAAASD